MISFLRICAPAVPRPYGGFGSKHLSSTEKGKEPPRCASAAGLYALRFRVGAAWSWVAETLSTALPPSREGSPESANRGMQGRSPKCPSQASGDSSPFCGVGPGQRFGNIRQPHCFSSLQTPLRVLPLTAAGPGSLIFFFFGGGILVSQVAVGERAGVHCEPQLKSLAPGSFSKARSLEIGAKAGDFGLGIVRWGVELSRRPLSS